MIKAIALDDEPLSLDIIKAYCKQLDFIDLKQCFTSQKKTIDYIVKNEVDLIFLDIEMPELDGFSLYKSLSKNINVIFTTAYKDYALEAFNINASDYLLKPFSFDRFLTAVQKVSKKLYVEKEMLNKETSLKIKANYQIHTIQFNNILFIEAYDDYIKIHLSNNTKIVTRCTMKNILTKLPVHLFVRIHRSYIVAVNKITALKNKELVIDKQTLPVSSTYKNKLLKNFNT